MYTVVQRHCAATSCKENKAETKEPERNTILNTQSYITDTREGLQSENKAEIRCPIAAVVARVSNAYCWSWRVSPLELESVYFVLLALESVYYAVLWSWRVSTLYCQRWRVSNMHYLELESV